MSSMATAHTFTDVQEDELFHVGKRLTLALVLGRQDMLIPLLDQSVHSVSLSSILEYRGGVWGYSLLDTVITNKNLHMARILLEYGIDVESRGQSDVTPLMHAAMLNVIDAGKLLIAAGANVNAVSQGQTPIVFAVTNGAYVMVKLLLENGAQLGGGLDSIGQKCLCAASKAGYLYIIKLLVAYGADLSSECVSEAFVQSYAQNKTVVMDYWLQIQPDLSH